MRNSYIGKFFVGFMATTMLFGSNAMANEKNIKLDIVKEEPDGYLNLKKYVESTFGIYKKENLADGEKKYIVNINSTIGTKKATIEVESNKNTMKLNDMDIACNFKEVSGYNVPSNSKKIIEKDETVFIPFSVFETIFGATVEKNNGINRLVLPLNLADYIEKNIKVTGGEKDVTESDERNESSEEPLSGSNNNLPVVNPTEPVGGNPSTGNRPIVNPPNSNTQTRPNNPGGNQNNSTAPEGNTDNDEKPEEENNRPQSPSTGEEQERPSENNPGTLE